MRTSVIIPNYNYADYLPAALDSLLSQSILPDEIIVVDDGSTDHSRAVLESYGDKILAIFQANAGQAAALNKGYAAATGDIVMFLDSDDVFFPNKVESILKIYKDNPDAEWVFHNLKQLSPAEGKDRSSYPVVTDGVTSRRVDERETMRRAWLDYDAPATSGLTFRKPRTDHIFPLPIAESISVSDHYIKFYALATSQGIHVDAALGGQIIHGANLYTGADDRARVTRGKIFVNTAYYLRQIVPDIARFCNDMMIEGRLCLGTAKLDNVLRGRIQDYHKQISGYERAYIGVKLALKKVLMR